MTIMGNTWLSQVCSLMGTLQITLAQIRYLECLYLDLGWEYALDEGEVNELAERMHFGVEMLTRQVYDYALLSKRQTLKEINQLLAANELTRNNSLEEDSKSYRVKIIGDVDLIVRNTGYGCYDVLAAQKNYERPEDGVAIWVASREYGEVLKDRRERALDGEFWLADGILGRIFWPFLICLDGTCLPVNGMMALVVDIEITEK